MKPYKIFSCLIICFFIVSVNAQQEPTTRRDSLGKGVEINPQDGMCYVLIPPGTYQMECSPDDRDCQDELMPLFSWEKPRHRVTISKGF